MGVELPMHMCLVALNAALCQLYHRYELQHLSTKFALNSTMTCPRTELPILETHATQRAIPDDFAAWLEADDDNGFFSKSWKCRRTDISLIGIDGRSLLCNSVVGRSA